MRCATTAIIALMILGCGPEAKPQYRSEAARDSAIAESAVPGASGVKSALSVADSAEARRAREDSIMSAEDR